MDTEIQTILAYICIWKTLYMRLHQYPQTLNTKELIRGGVLVEDEIQTFSAYMYI